jgi:hypothetical protein
MDIAKRKSLYERITEVTGGHDVVVTITASTLALLIDNRRMMPQKQVDDIADAVFEQVKRKAS